MEAISVGYAYALEADDVIAPMHRDMGAFLIRGMKLSDSWHEA
jgi:pyruvate dehydrogenase E1 component alpha subunit